MSELIMKHNETLYKSKPDVDLPFLQSTFDNIPDDNYYPESTRFRTTSRVKIVDGDFVLLDRFPLYQPTYVNNIQDYGGISRDYEDAPDELIHSEEFKKLINKWLSFIPFDVDAFSVHQIRTTELGCPTPEGRHQDGTYWTGLYILKRHNIKNESAKTTYWDEKGDIIYQGVLQEGELVAFNDPHYTHGTTSLEKDAGDEFSYRDVFVLTVPEHSVILPEGHGDKPDE